jgi:TonB family protein
LLGSSGLARTVYYPGNGVSLPTVVKEIHLIGPAAATVGIDCVVGENGRVSTATVANSPDAQLNDVAVRALRQWQFKPGMKDGKPVSVHIFVEVSIDKM